MTRTPRQPPPTLATRKPAGKAPPKRATAWSSAKSTLRTRVARIGAAVGVVAAVVGLIASLTSLFDWFQAKTTKPSITSPAHIDSRLVAAKLSQRNVPLGQYLQDNGQSSGGYTHDELAEQGLVFTVRVRLQGTVGQQISVNWRMFHSDGRALPKDIYSQTPGSFTPANEDHARTVPFWAPYPPRRGRYFIRFSLLDAKHQPLDVKSAHFTISSVPRLTTR
jgi:hypothetical protein